MTASKNKTGKDLSLADEFVQLHKNLTTKKNPSDEDVERLRKIVVSAPAAWSLVTHTMPNIRQAVIEKMSHRVSRAYMLAETDILAKQLGYDAAAPLERLLIDHILTVRLRLIHAEQKYTNCVMNQATTFREAEYWDNLLSSTQARFLRAILTLSRVRRLARNTPDLQINIASEGCKQVNVQAEANGRKEGFESTGDHGAGTAR